MKAVARFAADKTRDDALLHEQAMLREHMRSFDFAEGLQAFGEEARARSSQGRWSRLPPSNRSPKRSIP